MQTRRRSHATSNARTGTHSFWAPLCLSLLRQESCARASVRLPMRAGVPARRAARPRGAASRLIQALQRLYLQHRAPVVRVNHSSAGQPAGPVAHMLYGRWETHGAGKQEINHAEQRRPLTAGETAPHAPAYRGCPAAGYSQQVALAAAAALQQRHGRSSSHLNLSTNKPRSQQLLVRLAFRTASVHFLRGNRLSSRARFWWPSRGTVSKVLEPKNGGGCERSTALAAGPCLCRQLYRKVPGRHRGMPGASGRSSAVDDARAAMRRAACARPHEWRGKCRAGVRKHVFAALSTVLATAWSG